MKKLIIFLSLTGCAVLNPQRYSDCSEMARILSNGSGWVDQCMGNDGVYKSGFRQVAYKSSPEELCPAGQMAADVFERSAIAEAIREKKIDCSPILANQPKVIVVQQPVHIIQRQQQAPAYQRPIRTDCRETITGISCTSGPTGPDLSVFERTRSIDDYRYGR